MWPTALGSLFHLFSLNHPVTPDQRTLRAPYQHPSVPPTCFDRSIFSKKLAKKLQDALLLKVRISVTICTSTIIEAKLWNCICCCWLWLCIRLCCLRWIYWLHWTICWILSLALGPIKPLCWLRYLLYWLCLHQIGSVTGEVFGLFKRPLCLCVLWLCSCSWLGCAH